MKNFDILKILLKLAKLALSKDKSKVQLPTLRLAKKLIKLDSCYDPALFFNQNKHRDPSSYDASEYDIDTLLGSLMQYERGYLLGEELYCLCLHMNTRIYIPYQEDWV